MDTTNTNDTAGQPFTATEIRMQVDTLDAMRADLHKQWHNASMIAIEEAETTSCDDPAYQLCKSLAAEYDLVSAWLAQAKNQLAVARVADGMDLDDALALRSVW